MIQTLPWTNVSLFRPQSLRRRSPYSTRTVTAPSPPKSSAPSWGRWVRTPRRRSFRTWSTRWTLTVCTNATITSSSFHWHFRSATDLTVTLSRNSHSWSFLNIYFHGNICGLFCLMGAESSVALQSRLLQTFSQLIPLVWILWATDEKGGWKRLNCWCFQVNVSPSNSETKAEQIIPEKTHISLFRKILQTAPGSDESFCWSNIFPFWFQEMEPSTSQNSWLWWPEKWRTQTARRRSARLSGYLTR